MRDTLAGDELLNGLIKGVVDYHGTTVEHLAGLVLKGHAGHEVINPFIKTQSLVSVGRIGILSDNWVGYAQRDASQEEKTGPHDEDVEER